MAVYLVRHVRAIAGVAYAGKGIITEPQKCPDLTIIRMPLVGDDGRTHMRLTIWAMLVDERGHVIDHGIWFEDAADFAEYIQGQYEPHEAAAIFQAL
jgi:hypothetical protein